MVTRQRGGNSPRGRPEAVARVCQSHWEIIRWHFPRPTSVHLIVFIDPQPIETNLPKLAGCRLGK